MQKSRLNCETAKYLIYCYNIWLWGQDLLKALPLKSRYKGVGGERNHSYPHLDHIVKF